MKPTIKQLERKYSNAVNRNQFHKTSFLLAQIRYLKRIAETGEAFNPEHFAWIERVQGA
jgi:hypothetical protein